MALVGTRASSQSMTRATSSALSPVYPATRAVMETSSVLVVDIVRERSLLTKTSHGHDIGVHLISES